MSRACRAASAGSAVRSPSARAGLALAAGAHTDNHVAAAFMQVQGVGPALAAITDDGDRLGLEFCRVDFEILPARCGRVRVLGERVMRISPDRWPVGLKASCRVVVKRVRR